MNRRSKIATAIYKIIGAWMILAGISEFVVKCPVNPIAYGICLCILGWISLNMKVTIGGG